MNGRRCALTTLAIALSFSVGVPIALSQHLTDEWVEKAAGPLIENRIVDGLSIGYIEGDHWGIVHLGSSTRVGKNANNLTLYELGSISKIFTSLLLADAAVRGEIDLNAAVDIDNPAKIRFPSRDGTPITWLDLSTHRSGLPRLPTNLPLTDLQDPYRTYTSKKAAAFLKQYELPRQPGETQEYSNFAVSVLGYVIAVNAGKSYEELLQERIAAPLRMTDCTVAPSSAQAARLATPHDKFGSTASPWTFADLPGAGGVHATLRDMMRFAKAQLNPPAGKLGEAIELAWKQQRDADNSGPAMGLGWMIAGDGQTRWHNGQTGGYHAALFINREFKCAAVILCNTAVDDVDALAIQLIQKAAGLPEKTKRDKSENAPTKSSPFTAVRFDGEQTIVTYNGKSYEWLELDGIKVEDIVASSKKQFGGQWQKRIGEDLVELLWGMDHRPGDSVKLRLLDLQSKQDVVIDNAPMTRENRSAIRANLPPAWEAAPDGEDVPIDTNLRGRLVGRYQLAPEFIFDVSDRDGRLMVGATNQPSLEVLPDSSTRWSNQQLDATIEFELPQTGPAKSLVLHQGGAQQTAKRIENDLAIDAKLRSRLVGRYQILPNFIFDVQNRDGHLMVGITNQPTLEVHADSPTRWHYREVDATLEFQLPKTGRARSLILHQDGAAQTARRIK